MNPRVVLLPACLLVLSCALTPPKPHLYVSPSVRFVDWPARAMILPILNYVPNPMTGAKTDDLLFTLIGQSKLFVLENPSLVERALDEADVEWVGTIDKERLCGMGRKLGARLVIAPVLRKYEEQSPSVVYIGLTIYDVDREELLFYNEQVVSARDNRRLFNMGAERSTARNLETAVKVILRPFMEASARVKSPAGSKAP